MAPFTMRALVPAEIVIARSVFGDGVEWARVRVAQLPPMGFAAMVPFGRVIFYSRAKARRDFAQAPVAEQGLFVHELAHVWQGARGTVLALAKLRALGRGAYRYAICAGACLADFNIEAQAEIARHLFLSRLGSPTPAPREWLEDVWAGR